ncbi:hypothetical protein B0E43_19640 [Algoriphagus sp. A40]|nr:hypothetical protein B0E43_19640 [Algoriphagus sp. A40]
MPCFLTDQKQENRFLESPTLKRVFGISLGIPSVLVGLSLQPSREMDSFYHIFLGWGFTASLPLFL